MESLKEGFEDADEVINITAEPTGNSSLITYVYRWSDNVLLDISSQKAHIL